MTMHENIAQAIHEVRDDPFDTDEWEDTADKERYRCDATAALAVLATPTPAMLNAGAEAVFAHSPRPGEDDDDGAPSPVCQCGWECDPNSPLSLAQQGERHVLAAVYAAMVAAAGEEA